MLVVPWMIIFNGSFGSLVVVGLCYGYPHLQIFVHWEWAKGCDQHAMHGSHFLCSPN
jgi:hypothetical protein